MYRRCAGSQASEASGLLRHLVRPAAVRPLADVVRSGNLHHLQRAVPVAWGAGGTRSDHTTQTRARRYRRAAAGSTLAGGSGPRPLPAPHSPCHRTGFLMRSRGLGPRGLCDAFEAML